jgi:hypothetical protein
VTRDALDKFAYSMLAMYRRQVLGMNAAPWAECGDEFRRLTREHVGNVLDGHPELLGTPESDAGREQQAVFVATVQALKPFLKG